MQLSLYASLYFQACDGLTVMTSESQGLMISVHMSFLQLNDIESVTSQLL